MLTYLDVLVQKYEKLYTITIGAYDILQIIGIQYFRSLTLKLKIEAQWYIDKNNTQKELN